MSMTKLRTWPSSSRVGAGLLLLVIPGLVFIVWFALAGPLLEAEKLGVMQSMRVSRELVRGSFWRVAGVVHPLAVITNVLAEGVYEGQRGGRQRGKKALCAVAIEIRGRGSGRVRLAPLPNASIPSLSAFLTATTAPGAIVHTDGWHGYNGLEAAGYERRARSQRAAVGEEPYLPRAHRAISNLKAWLAGTHRGVSNEHLAVYLEEFTFRHNRRAKPMAAFQTLLGLSAVHEPTTYAEITSAASLAA